MQHLIEHGPLAPPEPISQEKFKEIWNHILSSYVEKIPDTPRQRTLCFQKFNEGKIYECLDFFSSYLTPAKRRLLEIRSRGSYIGTGILIDEGDKDFPTLLDIIEGAPADRSGQFHPFDTIVEINGINVRQKSIFEIMVMLDDGEEGSFVSARVTRKGVMRPPVFLKREMIMIKTVTAYDIEEEITFLKVGCSFSEETPKELLKTIAEKRAAKPSTAFVLDLRGVLGGPLIVPPKIGAYFARDASELLLTRIAREDTFTIRVKDLIDEGEITLEEVGILRDVVLMALINQFSVSATEGVAAILRDLGGVLLIGDKTFGKGSVQRVVPLSDGSGLNLTIGRFSAVHGIEIEERGVKPDIKVRIPYGKDPVLCSDALDLHNDRQLRRAVEVISKKRDFDSK